jgi:DNA-binding response OmpR family regulator
VLGPAVAAEQRVELRTVGHLLVHPLSSTSARGVGHTRLYAIADQNRRHRMRILLVEDDGDVASLIAFVLEAAGHVVVELSDGREAIDRLGDLAFDLALVDVMLPGADGFEVVRAIRAHDRHRATPVVQLTARAGEDDHIQGYQAGADAYLVKPFEPAGVAEMLQELVDRTPEQRARERAEQLRRAQFLRGLEHRF